ncbi:unnamed protein product [Didymodactylos carnosus]|nr:unnamed protein product [Didymodactylos carnosus]CAF4417356.1 unnamed protein product [Didymodactylos carnosus]
MRTAVTNDDFTITELQLKAKKDSKIHRKVYHAYFTAWPDRAIPDTPDSMIRFLREVDKWSEQADVKGPKLIHCSAGIGRTGTFITIDINIKRYISEQTVDIYQTVEELRKHRISMIQGHQQYLYCFTVLKALIERL